MKLTQENPPRLLISPPYDSAQQLPVPGPKLHTNPQLFPNAVVQKLPAVKQQYGAVVVEQ
jgi:hypothetical protein